MGRVEAPYQGAGMEADFVIVGTGAAGCVLADRLSEGGARVLVIEHGGTDAEPFIRMPGALSYPMTMARYDWGSAPSPSRTWAAAARPARGAR